MQLFHILYFREVRIQCSEGSDMGGKKGTRNNNAVVRIHNEAPRPLPRYQLPLYRDVDQALEDAENYLLLSRKDSVRKVVREVKDIYSRAEGCFSPSAQKECCKEPGHRCKDREGEGPGAS